MTAILTDECCPADWLDEVPPALGKTPGDFLRVKDGEIYLTPLDEADDFLAGDLTEDGSYLLTRLQVGQEVGFMFFEKFEAVPFAVDDMGNIAFTGTWPDRANCFGSGPDLVICQTAEDAARELLAIDDELREIDVWYWSSEVAFILCLNTACAPRFARKGRAQ